MAMKHEQILRRSLEEERSNDMVDAFSLRRVAMETQKYPLQSEKSSLDAPRLEKVSSTRILQVFEIARW